MRTRSNSTGEERVVASEPLQDIGGKRSGAEAAFACDARAGQPPASIVGQMLDRNHERRRAIGVFQRAEREGLERGQLAAAMEERKGGETLFGDDGRAGMEAQELGDALVARKRLVQPDGEFEVAECESHRGGSWIECRGRVDADLDAPDRAGPGERHHDGPEHGLGRGDRVGKAGLEGCYGHGQSSPRTRVKKSTRVAAVRASAVAAWVVRRCSTGASAWSMPSVPRCASPSMMAARRALAAPRPSA